MTEPGVVVPSPAPGFSALLNAFRSISANAVYTMAPKESVVRGYEYYRQQRTYPQLLIHRNGVPLSGGWVPALPSELVPLLNRSWYSGFEEDPLLHYLKLHDKPWPIVLASGKESIPLQWNQSVKCQSKTEIDLVGGHMRIRAVCLADGVSLERIVRFRNFVTDLNGGRLLYLRDETGWTSFRSLRQRFGEAEPFLDPYDDPDAEFRAVTLSGESGYRRWQGIDGDTEFTISLDEFQSAQVELAQKKADRILRNLVLKVEGQDLSVQRLTFPPSGMAPSCALILKPPHGRCRRNAAVVMCCLLRASQPLDSSWRWSKGVRFPGRYAP
jgi:hypothetical protein